MCIGRFLIVWIAATGGGLISPPARASCGTIINGTVDDAGGFLPIFRSYFSSVADAQLQWHVSTEALNVEQQAEADEVKRAEILKGGTIIQSAKDFEGLSDGMYPYLITSKGFALFIPRAFLLDQKQIDQNDGRFLGTHRSMFAKILQFDADPIIIAAGEFEISFSRVNNISNMSGSFRSGPVHLKFAIAYLKYLGLPIEPQTIEAPVPKNGQDVFSPHFSALGDAKMRIRAYNDPQFGELAQRANMIRKNLYELRPAKSASKKKLGGPGKINPDELLDFDKSEFYLEIGSGDFQKGADQWSTAVHLLHMIFRKGEGVAAATQIEGLSIAKTSKMLATLEGLYRYLSKKN